MHEGESGSNAYSREGKHFTALHLKQGDNALWKHCLIAIFHESSWHLPALLGPPGEWGCEDQEEQGTADEQQGSTPPAPGGEGCADPRIENEPGEIPGGRGQGEGGDGERPESTKYFDMILFFTI